MTLSWPRPLRNYIMYLITCIWYLCVLLIGHNAGPSVLIIPSCVISHDSVYHIFMNSSLLRTFCGKPRRGLQIMDTRMGFPCPFRNMVKNSISLGVVRWILISLRNTLLHTKYTEGVFHMRESLIFWHHFRCSKNSTNHPMLSKSYPLATVNKASHILRWWGWVYRTKRDIIKF